MEENLSKAYAKLDDRGRVLRVEGGYTISNIDNIDEWTYIGSGSGDTWNLCQTHLLPKPLYEDRGIPRYKYVDGEIVERTQAEIDADYVEPVPVPSQLDRVEAQTMYTALMTDTLIEEV